MSLQLAQFVSGIRFEDLGADVIDAAIANFTDTLAVGWAGTGAPGIPAARAIAVEQGGRAESVVWGTGERIPALEAAFVNAAAAAALDYDTVHQGSIMHADATVMPAALALAERVRASGREFLAAYVAGIEVAHRLSMATPRLSGWFNSSTLGVFGAAAAGARLLRLDPLQTSHALGIALSSSGGTKQAIVERTLTKRLQTALATRAGLHAALLAAGGVTGPSRWLDGPYGWSQLYENVDLDKVHDGLGRRFAFLETGMKKYPCCLCNHAAIDATLQLLAEHGLESRDVQGARVTISPYMHRLVGAPYEPGVDSQVSAQFSVQYVMATTIRHGRFTLGELDPAMTDDPDIVAQARAIVVSIDETWPGQTSPAMVTLSTSRSEFTRRIDVLPGSAERRLSAVERSAKFGDCVARGAAPLASDRAHALAARCAGIASVADLSSFFDEAIDRV
jgi:2-methylcitrate dehydratase PrpD